MKALLKIPFNEKDNAKKLAKENHCALYWEPFSKSWTIQGNIIPDELKKYIIEGSLLESEINQRNDTLDWPDFSDNGIEIKKTSIKYTNEYYNYVLAIPFELKEMAQEFGAYFHSLYKTYIIRAANIQPKWEKYLCHPYSYEAWIEKFINNGQVRDDIKSKFVSKDLIEARDYQMDAVNIIEKSSKSNLGGFLLADEVGLGKTISAALVSKFDEYKTILIVTTLSATAHWRNIYLKFNYFGKEILIINYDRLQKLFYFDESKYKAKAKTRKTKNKRMSHNGLAPIFDLVIWDESHKMRNNTAMRAKLGLKIQVNAKFNLYLSATAGQNPLELSYLAPLLAKITGQKVSSMNEFEKWCRDMDLGVYRGDYGKWMWDGNDKSIKKIHDLLFKENKAALRRTPKDIKGYPEINRIVMPFELDADERKLYDLSWSEFCNDTKSKQINKENALVARLRLRQKTSNLKINYTVEQILDLLENGQQVAVSIAFKDTMFNIQEKLNKKAISCSLIYGGQSAEEKESERVKFQKGENTVVLFTVEEAISLHQGEYNDVPRSMLIHDLRWSAISMSQIEGRTHRDGKFSQIYWLYFEDTIEYDIAQIVLNRVINMKAMVGDDTQVLKEIEKLLLKKMK